MDRYITEEGKVAYLVSRGFGAGWSTWDEENAEFLLFDITLIEYALGGRSMPNVQEYLDRVFGNDEIYCGGWDGITVRYCDKGDVVVVEEYDGSETDQTERPAGIVA